uniref:Uncharacterized protein n=1 Tax=Aegilops tauschii subsp. strangulata TaxID=200361 RepID=A0A453RDL1_AEGTS
MKQLLLTIFVYLRRWKNPCYYVEESKINEKSIYAFNNFKVMESTKYRPMCNEIKIYFSYNTKVKEIKDLQKFSQIIASSLLTWTH